jgi:hypothetical protein
VLADRGGWSKGEEDETNGYGVSEIHAHRKIYAARWRWDKIISLDL